MPVRGDRLVTDVSLPAPLTEHRVQKRVDEHVAAVDAQTAQQPLDPLTGLAYQDPPRDRLMRGWVLPDDQHPGGAIEATAVEDRSPLHSERVRRVHRLVRVVAHQAAVWLPLIAGVKVPLHGRPPRVGPPHMGAYRRRHAPYLSARGRDLLSDSAKPHGCFRSVTPPIRCNQWPDAAF
jgi:hypothetical protein